MNSILQATAELLKSRKFNPAFTEDGATLVVRCRGKHLYWTTDVDTSEDGTIITLLTRIPAKVPPAKRSACAKLLARLNYGKRQGSFQLDLGDGEVLFCISNMLPAGIAPEETLDSLFGTTFAAMNEAAPEILKVVYGGSPEAASKPAAPGRSIAPPGIDN